MTLKYWASTNTEQSASYEAADDRNDSPMCTQTNQRLKNNKSGLLQCTFMPNSFSTKKLQLRPHLAVPGHPTTRTRFHPSVDRKHHHPLDETDKTQQHPLKVCTLSGNSK